MTRRLRIVGMGLLAAVLALINGGTAAASMAAPTHAKIEGNGSSWSANAVNQWIADVQPQGLEVVFTSTGSAQGRKDFAYGTNDYAVSDIAFQGVDPKTGDVDASTRKYVYLPIVAGGTAFPYQIKVAGKLVQDLRLSGRTLAKIFTGQITNWNDAAITADNNGRRLPSLGIKPIVHSEGSGSSAMFSRYLAKMFPDIWTPFNQDPGMTEYFPTPHNGVAQNGSDQVMNFIASAAANGAIGYDEYSYARNAGFPVAKVENAKQFFTLPDQYNVAVALRNAIINEDPTSSEYLIQNLDNVYTATQDQVYPLSSYSYMILPVGTNAQDARMTTQKRQTLTDFLYYSICSGQKTMGPIGYSPLPINLVQSGFAQINKLKTADPKVDVTNRDVSTCDNPTFIKDHPERNHLAEIAPEPPACDHVGAGPCPPGTTGRVNPNPGSTGGGGNNGGTGGPATGPGAGNPTPQTTVRIDPDTGQIVPGTGADNGSADVTPAPNELASASGAGLSAVLGPMAVAEVVAVIVLPVLVSQALARRRRGRP